MLQMKLLFIFPIVIKDEPLSNNDELMAFSDKWVDMNDTNSSYYVEDGNMVVLDNDYLQFLCSRNNTLDRKDSTTGALVYRVFITYYDYKNTEVHKTIWYGRSSDFSNYSKGNNILFLQLALEQDYYKDATIRKDVDALNIANVECMDQCELVINDLLEEWYK